MAVSLFNRHADRLVERHGARVWRIGIDAGFSCPHRGSAGITGSDGAGRGSGGCRFCPSSAGRAVYLGDRGDGNASIGGQVERGLAFLVRRYGATIFFPYFQAYTSTNRPVRDLRRLYDEGLAAVERLAPRSLRGLVVSTRPDCIDGERVALLAEYAASGLETWVEFGLQTARDDTLLRVNRGHGVREFLEAMDLVRGKGLRIGVHLMLGLPGESREDMVANARFVAGTGVDGIKFHDLRIVRGSAMAADFLAGELSLPAPSTLPAILADCIVELTPGIEVVRLCSDFPASVTLAPKHPFEKAALYRAVEAELASRGARQGSARSAGAVPGDGHCRGRPASAILDHAIPTGDGPVPAYEDGP